MSTIVSVFCQSEEPPSLQDILEWLLEEEHKVSYDPETLPGDADTPEWETADMLIEDSHTAIQLDCFRGQDHPEFRKACAPFEGKLLELDDIAANDPVRQR